MPRPHLRTARLELEPLTRDHLEDLVELDGDPEVMRFLTGRPSTRDEVVTTWLPRRTEPEHDTLGLGYWCGYEEGTFAGWWCLTPADPGSRCSAGAQAPRNTSNREVGGADVAWLGYRLRRSAWGRGLATEGAEALLEHGFRTVGLVGVMAETMAVNDRSRRVLSALGMRHISTEVREWDDPLPGAEEGEVTYAVTAREWRRLRPAAR